MSLQSNLVPSATEMTIYQTMAKQAASSKFYNSLGGEGGVMMIMLAARELGLPPVQALNGGIHIIQGKVEISARMMSAMIRKAGHKIEIRECSDDKCTLFGVRSDTGESLEVSFSVEDAKKAGLYKLGGGWVKWPKDMCFARALSRLARQLFSDVVGIGYVEGEIKDSGEMPESMETIAAEVLDVEIRPSDKDLADSPKMKNLREEAQEQFDQLSDDQRKRCQVGLERNNLQIETADEEGLNFILDGIASIKGGK